VSAAAALARQTKTPVYLAGGAVRDLLLRRAIRDVDLVVEGDGVALARRLARRLSAPIREHPRFATATLRLSDAASLDVATARTETYRRPGALPEIRPAGIAEDLARRDFTVNAMALRIAPGPPRLLDPQGGWADLRKGVIRMLHAASPRDDPTRSFRAVLYANRLGFRIEGHTRRWIAEAARAGLIDSISGDRLRREMTRLLSEPRRAAAVSQLSRLGLAQAVHPGLSAGPGTRTRLARAERLAGESPPGPSWFAYLLVWCSELSTAQAEALCGRLNLPRGQARSLRRWPGLRSRFAAASEPLRGGLSADESLALASMRTRHRAPEAVPAVAVRGRDLVDAGIPPGPAIGRALAMTRAARRLKRIGPEEELSFALNAAREAGK
jgi:tRNA nucleotidyltransferase (CCA-adding enzyme)